MSKIEPKTLKGFRDFLPTEARKRQYVINTLQSVFASFGFEPLETPTLEYEEILTGKYGTEGDKLMYRFEDNGGRRVAMRYDQTVPLARVVAQYGSLNSSEGQPLLPFPLKRYQIQPVWRAENTQKGRFREFLQCDADIVGTDSPLADAETVYLAAAALKRLGFNNYKILINDRNVFEDSAALLRASFPNDLEQQLDLFFTIAQAVDKIKKIGKEGVIKELINKGLNEKQALTSIDIVSKQQPTQRLKEVFKYLSEFGTNEDQFSFDPLIARGLNYYTGLIFEIEIDGYTAGSVCGGGRYDNLIGMFAGQQIPAVGFAFGFDRLMEAMDQLGLFPANLQKTNVLVTIFSPELKEKSLEISSRLRSNNINTELYLQESAKMEKQLKYADQKGIPYVIIIGPNEAEKNVVVLKNMKTREQKELDVDGLIDLLRNA